LIPLIDNTLDHGKLNRVCLVGAGKLGKAILNFLNETDNNLSMKASFDLDPSLKGKQIEGVPSFHISEMDRVIRSEKINIAVLTTPPDDVENIVKMLVDAGIKGILNFVPVTLDVPEDVYVRECDVITYIDEIGYYIEKD
jgi:redox-sensing transcriptional repressor